jgi:hypothetical protein
MLPPVPIFEKIVDEYQVGGHNEKRRERGALLNGSSLDNPEV